MNAHVARRHSMAESLLFGSGTLNERMESMRLEESVLEEPAQINMEAIDDYFSAEPRSRANSDSKAYPYDPATHMGPIYVVEFKAGRTDHFFVPEMDGEPVVSIALNDLVLVEADRGKVSEIWWVLMCRI